MHRTQEPRLRLFVFHHAGGSHLAYRDWPARFPAGWQVHLPDAPGRGPRDERPALHDTDALVDHYLHTLGDTLTGPFAFFGHSLGAVVAYELTRRLVDEGHTPPRWLGLSARDPLPALPHPNPRPHRTANPPNTTATGTGTGTGTGTTGTAHPPYTPDAASTTAAAGTAVTINAAGATYGAGTTYAMGATGATGTAFGAGAEPMRDPQGAASTGTVQGSEGAVGMDGVAGVRDTVGPAGGGRHLLSDAELRRELTAMGGTPPAVLDHPQLWELFAPVIRADLRINETWRPRPAAVPLPVPLSVFGGRHDQVAPPHLLGGWAQTCEPFLGIRLFEGGHFYFQDRLPEVTQHIQEDVRRALLHSPTPSACAVTS
ncbi:alpha/beta fold hydrolase [Streptomyces sp. NBC_00340]|uniref:thioesterase II family protein n=1 Tax=Streptomyces sp. NBC_00340 TaxID=2975716 RepID=UPI00225AB045|nr:thioesterase domain-containing protein [Streptomyces sp. NBC_00340]MCX5134070.1 alpha/beta fold hydrolase [Streptomyces sp. NBC_00340]MCX5136392.1 alpha/beta fold hydrolase [Streptomyces sp. NBC_00340]MCX5138331.1 alpha/beta fold hydrolase [Streptomyces sp. NBC_00340]